MTVALGEVRNALGRPGGCRSDDSHGGASCPACESRETRVVDSRPRDDGSIRRRRKCTACGERFTTWEVLAERAFAGPPAAELIQARRLIQQLDALLNRWRSYDEMPS